MKHTKKAGKYVVLVIVAVIAGVCIFNAISKHETNSNNTQQAKVQQQSEINQLGDLYSNISKYNQVFPDIGNENPLYLQVPTKYFIIERTDSSSETASDFTYSPLYFSLPDAIKAKSDDELNTLVKIVRSTYDTEDDNGATVHRDDAYITFIDMKSNHIINQHEFNTIIPQHVSDSDIISYIEGLCGYTLGDLYSNISSYSQMQGTYTGPLNVEKPTKYFIIEKDSSIKGNFTYSQINSILPDALKAKSSDELNTLVQIEDSTYQSGNYSNGAPAYTLDVKITVFDMKTKNIIDQTELYGAPPNSIYESNTEGAVGVVTYDSVISYLESLVGYTEK